MLNRAGALHSHTTEDSETSITSRYARFLEVSIVWKWRKNTENRHFSLPLIANSSALSCSAPMELPSRSELLTRGTVSTILRQLLIIYRTQINRSADVRRTRTVRPLTSVSPTTTCAVPVLVSTQSITLIYRTPTVTQSYSFRGHLLSAPPSRRLQAVRQKVQYPDFRFWTNIDLADTGTMQWLAPASCSTTPDAR